MAQATCPGSDRADACDSRACRYGGCQGRMPTPKPPKETRDGDEEKGQG